ncbi:MAG: isocitrate lyase/phosphoenolpyruvate mutase family protein [Labedaea sp.]
MTRTQSEKAELFHALHHDQGILTLPNAWDVASARIVVAAGAAAVATTSAGVAWSLGAADGGNLTGDEAIGLVARVAAAVDVPMTADIEAGYADSAESVARTVRLVIEAGAVGVNLEDGWDVGDSPLRPAGQQAERLAAARAAADASGVRLFINARTDNYLFGVGEPEGRLAATLERAALYVAAGADGVFVPGVVDPETIAELAKEIDAPLNIMAGPGSPPVRKLADLGVARVSTGAASPLAAYAAARRAAVELLTAGTYEALACDLTFPELNALLRR